MANEMVKYDNLMNELSFRGFEQRDFDFLMALCSRMRNLGEEEQKFSYEYLMKLVDWDRSQKIERFHKDLGRMNKKLLSINASVILDEKEGREVDFVLFYNFERNLSKRELTVSVNKRFMGLLNSLSSNFTKFELSEYVHLDSRYSKQIYTQLKQRYRLRQHFWRPTVEELRTVLSIPESYTTKRLYTLLIEPSIETIKKCKGFEKLKCEVVRDHKRGRPVIGYYFTWTDQLSLFDPEVENSIGTSSKKRTLDQKDKSEKSNKKNKNKFNNFNQREYDMVDLERQLLNS